MSAARIVAGGKSPVRSWYALWWNLQALAGTSLANQSGTAFFPRVALHLNSYSEYVDITVIHENYFSLRFLATSLDSELK